MAARECVNFSFIVNCFSIYIFFCSVYSHSFHVRLFRFHCSQPHTLRCCTTQSHRRFGKKHQLTFDNILHSLCATCVINDSLFFLALRFTLYTLCAVYVVHLKEKKKVYQELHTCTPQIHTKIFFLFFCSFRISYKMVGKEDNNLYTQELAWKQNCIIRGTNKYRTHRRNVRKKTVSSSGAYYVPSKQTSKRKKSKMKQDEANGIIYGTNEI